MSATDPLIIVGSGPSGIHAAWTLLAAGRQVTLLDFGRQGPEPVVPGASWTEMKEVLTDPSEYFLGRNFESLILPGNSKEYYGFPPSKTHVFDIPSNWRERSQGFEPLFSAAAGGLAEAWTGGSYPFDANETGLFPFPHAEWLKAYGQVAERIGISGVADDLSEQFPLYQGLLPPVELDDHAVLLLERYNRRRDEFHRRSLRMGQARLAVLSADGFNRRKCTRTGRCLWGCPNGALWTPRLGLVELFRFPGFIYVPGIDVRFFDVDKKGRVVRVTGYDTTRRSERSWPVGTLILAAGTLNSTRIYLASRRLSGKSPLTLTGLMDNRQVLMPFVTLSRLGSPWKTQTYQYHQLAMGYSPQDGDDYVHGLVTTLKTALIHPVVQSLPIDLRNAVGLFRDAHSALALVNINFSDRRRPENTVSLEAGADGDVLQIKYSPPTDEPARIQRTLKVFRKFLHDLGAFAPPGMSHVRPMGASVHYAGTLPMSREVLPETTTPEGRAWDHENLYFVDGTTFPFLPAKNLTFSLMANATRIAEALI